MEVAGPTDVMAMESAKTAQSAEVAVLKKSMDTC